MTHRCEKPTADDGNVFYFCRNNNQIISKLHCHVHHDWLLNCHRQIFKGMQVSTTSVQGCMPA